MGEFARRVQERLRNSLEETLPQYYWETEYKVSNTQLDIAGVSDSLIVVELEWRRADPADNTAKVFRHLSTGGLSSYESVSFFQVFTAYYDLSSGGLSSKRENAEFVGEVAADSFESLEYDAANIGINPPKRGGEEPEDWREKVGEAAEKIAEKIEPSV